jgi:dihydrofolate synthase / folylpolyglutamate synthase
MDFKEAIADLNGRQSESMPAPSLDRIANVVNLLDHPELTYPTIHIAGTNGKTTTSRLATSLACAHGITTGTFTSPHLESITDRLSICGRAITEEEFAEVYSHLSPYLQHVDFGSMRVTYFETLTALAYLWFADKPVGLAVFEVGMGGSWDATNLVRGDVAVICPVGLDHVQHLGTKIEQIATEKAGIIKEGRVAVVREQRPEAMEVIRARAAEVEATLLEEDRDFGLERRATALGGQAIDIRTPLGDYEELFVPLFGENAARNAAAAVTALEALLDRPLNPQATRAALASTTSPGRVEVMSRRPLVILDGAHNEDAARALVAALRESFRWDRLLLVMACFADKDVEELGLIVGPLADAAYVTRMSSPRAAPPDRIAAALGEGGVEEVRTFDSVREALGAARADAGENDLVLVTGSFYTVADARPLLMGA